MSKNTKTTVEHDIQKDLNELIEKIDDPNTEQTLKEFYDTVAKFNNYSFHNCWLLHNQAKQRGMNISYVASLKDFNELGATVNKGEKSLKVWAPKQQYEIKRSEDGKPIKDEKGNYQYVLDENNEKIKSSISFLQVAVFDRSQTNTYELGLIPSLEYRDKNTEISTEFLKDLYNEVNEKFNISIEEKFINNPNLGGYYQRDKQHITINSHESKTNSSKLTTLFHELGHHLLHGNENYRDMHLDRSMREGEAESLRFIVSRRFGITPKSELYLKSWDRNSENLQKHLKRITDSARKVIRTLDIESLYQKEQQRKELGYKLLDNLIQNPTPSQPSPQIIHEEQKLEMGLT